MNSRWKKNISMLCALTVAAVPMALNVGAGAPENNDSGVLVNEAVQIGEAYVEGYILTIPASFNVQNEGWNEIGDISAVGYLADGKKLVVSADSENHWGMKNEASGKYVNYDLKNSAEGDFTNQWEFTELSETPVTQKIGVDVEPFKGKDLPAGEYTDVLTFTASVEDAYIAVTDVTLDKTTFEIPVGETSVTLNATVSPDNATDKTVTWESSKTDVATVENGVVTPITYGITTITAKAGEKTANCNVIVNGIFIPGRGSTKYLKIPGASAENPVYFTGDYNGSVTTDSVPLSHSLAGSYDELYFNGSKIYRGNWAYGSALVIKGGSGTSDDPYVLGRI